VRAALLLALPLLACDGTGARTTAPSPPARGCHDDCPAALSCVHGACVGAAAPQYDVVLRITPPAASPVGAVEVRDVAFGGSPVLEAPDLPVPDRATTVRRVLRPSTRGDRPVTATVTARAEAAETPPPLGAEASTVETAEGPRFALSLPPYWPAIDGSQDCTLYRLRVVPAEAEELPPYEQGGLSLGCGGPAEDVILPAGPDGLQTLRGDVLVSADNPTPIAVQVVARDDDGRPVSTSVTTDAPTQVGHFEIRFWPAEAERHVTLRIEPVQQHDRPLPRVDVPVTVPAVGAAAPDLVIYIGDVGRVFTVHGRVAGLQGTTGAPLGGATLRFRGAIGNGQFETSAASARDGTFEVNLYPGEYLVDVDPGATDFRLLRSRLMIADGGGTLDLALRPRTPVAGRVVGPDGAALPGALIEARLVRAQYADPQLERPGEAPPARTDQATADADGRFTLKLDPGDHVLTVTPPADRGLPRLQVQRTVPADQPVELGALTVPPAAVIALKLSTEARADRPAAPLSNAKVEAWVLGGTGGPVLAGDGLSDADGQVTVIVPAGPPPLAEMP
jgi:hypothetical protein